MERLIQSIQAAHADASAVAWVALGVLLFTGIVLGILVLCWIAGGGLRNGVNDDVWKSCGRGRPVDGTRLLN